MTKPNFLVIGAPKCGTTSLYYYLRQHPEVFLPAQKELHFFSYDDLEKNSAGPGDRLILNSLCATASEYYAHFHSATGQAAIGDVSPSYLYYEVGDKIKSELGLIKIVVMLRNPVDKAHSQYMHMVRDQRETLSFDRALDLEQARIQKNWSDIWRYAESSLYAEKLLRYIDQFGTENCHVVLFEDFVRSPHEEMKKLFCFLGVDAEAPVDVGVAYNRTGESRSRALAEFMNRPSLLKSMMKWITPDDFRIRMRLKVQDMNTSKKIPLSEEARQYLSQYFESDTDMLRRILSINLDIWK